jgi:hypothetical protein
MNVSDMEVDLKHALAHQAQTSAALGEAVRDKLTAEADLKKAMVRYLAVTQLIPTCWFDKEHLSLHAVCTTTNLHACVLACQTHCKHSSSSNACTCTSTKSQEEAG